MKKNTGKIYLSKRAWKEFFSCYAFLLLLPISYIGEPKDSYIRLYGPPIVIIVMIGTQVFLFASLYRLFTHITVTTDTFTSYLLFKKLCVVDKNQPIYYGRFTEKLTSDTQTEFIVLSNTLFDYYKSHATFFKVYEKPFPTSFDMKKFVLIPYDNNTAQLFDFSEWIFVPQKPPRKKP